jgi:hypothetical protein
MIVVRHYPNDRFGSLTVTRSHNDRFQKSRLLTSKRSLHTVYRRAAQILRSVFPARKNPKNSPKGIDDRFLIDDDLRKTKKMTPSMSLSGLRAVRRKIDSAIE